MPHRASRCRKICLTATAEATCAAEFTVRFNLFGCAKIRLRSLYVGAGACYLALVPLSESFIHTFTVTSHPFKPASLPQRGMLYMNVIASTILSPLNSLGNIGKGSDALIAAIAAWSNAFAPD